jgi:hypothetical protein
MSDHITQPATSAEQYEPPRLKVLGSVRDLTLQGKTFGSSDGMWLVSQGQPNQGLTNVSG